MPDAAYLKGDALSRAGRKPEAVAAYVEEYKRRRPGRC